MKITAFDVAHRFIDIREIPGEKDHPLIQWGFMLCGWGVETADEVPWCSAFAQIPAYILRLPRSKSARARSWLEVGHAVGLGDAKPGFDVAILKRGDGDQPGPDNITAPGHVGFFAGWDREEFPSGAFITQVLVLGGNQGNRVSIVRYPQDRLLGIRRLA